MTVHHRLRAASGGSGGGWEILMVTQGKSNHNSYSSNAFGNTGSMSFRTISASSTGASNRTALNQGVGLYDAFFNKTGITKIALADWHKGGSGLDPTQDFNRYVVYDLVASTTKTIYDTILDLDTYNLNNSNWAGSPGDSMFGADSVDNFVAGNYESGNVSATSGNYTGHNGNYPDKFVIWGINRDSDNDTQVLCAYYGNLETGKGDSWRGNTPAQTFFSYWGNDWHSDSTGQTISKSSQTAPGFVGTGINQADYIYLLAS